MLQPSKLRHLLPLIASQMVVNYVLQGYDEVSYGARREGSGLTSVFSTSLHIRPSTSLYGVNTALQRRKPMSPASCLRLHLLKAV
jgi:hypothetical protein